MAAGTPTGSKRALGAATTPITEAAGAEAAGAGTTSTTRIKRAKRPERTPTDDAAIHAAIARDTGNQWVLGYVGVASRNVLHIAQ